MEEYEYEEEESTRNLGVGICWSPNTNFYGVDIQPLFDDNFYHSVPNNRVVNISQKPALDCRIQKINEHTHKSLGVNIYRDDTE